MIWTASISRGTSIVQFASGSSALAGEPEEFAEVVPAFPFEALDGFKELGQGGLLPGKSRKTSKTR